MFTTKRRKTEYKNSAAWYERGKKIEKSQNEFHQRDIRICIPNIVVKR